MRTMVQQAAVLFVTWLLSAFAYDVHKQMTIEEIRSTFHVNHHDEVPEYEVVHVHHENKRSITSPHGNKLEGSLDSKIDSQGEGVQTGDKRPTDRQARKIRLNAFGRPLNLSLVRNENLIKEDGLKVWTIEPNTTAQHGVEYIEIPQGKEEIGEIYQDEANEAAVILRQEDNGGLVMEGSIGSDLVIKPLPQRLRQLPSTTVSPTPAQDDDEMFLDDDGELNAEVAIDTGLPIKRSEKDEETIGHQHIVYKRKKSLENTYSDYAFMEPDHLGKRYRRSVNYSNSTNQTRRKREAPYTIYPEILVIVDYDGYRLHSGDNAQIKRYFISFWNGVDLRYKLLKGPKVRISIAGIIISRGRDATPYLERNRVGRDAIDSAAALTDMGKYLFRERRLPVYDIAVAITKYDMCRRRKGGRCTKGTAGFAYVGGACVVNKRLEKVNSVAIIEDTGGFSGIIVAAHEVGHLLGAVHDGSPPPSYLGGPGAEKCQWTDGYIMSDLRHTERGFRWSPCSISSFHHFLNGDTATCLFNTPHEEEGLPRVLPGKLMSLDAQCRRDRGTSACFKDERVCAQLFCFDATSGYCVAYRPAAEGSSCGDGQSCTNGKCVPENENIIPDYSQNSASYIRRTGPDQGRSLSDSQKEENLVDPYNSYPDQTTLNPYQYENQNDNPYNQNQYYDNQNRNPPSTDYFYYQHSSSTTEPNSYFSFGPQSGTKSPFSFHNNFRNRYTQSTTENEYENFNHRFTQSSTKIPTLQTQKNPYVGNYYQLIKQTTRNPYDFANFQNHYRNGKSAFNSQIQDIHNNYLKRSYSSAAYFDSSNSENVTTQDETT